jgi:hypothetical protein
MSSGMRAIAAAIRLTFVRRELAVPERPLLEVVPAATTIPLASFITNESGCGRSKVAESGGSGSSGI